MKAKETYAYEILIADESGKTEITTVKSLIMALSYSEKLWKKAELKAATIDDKGLDIHLQVQKIGTEESTLQSAFLIKVKSSSFDKTDAFRQNLLLHVKKKLGFSTTRVLSDGVSTKISQDIYPLIADVENQLRSYIAKHYIQTVGISWWKTIAPKAIIDKVLKRQDNEGVFAGLVDLDISLTDFDDLSSLSKSILNTSFQTKWEQLGALRSKVMQNHLFVSKDLNAAIKLSADITHIIADAESKSGVLKVSTSGKATIAEKSEKNVKPTVAAVKPKVAAKKMETPTKKAEKAKPTATSVKEKPNKTSTEKKVIEAPKAIAVKENPTPLVAVFKEPVSKTVESGSDNFKMISEDDLLKELKIAESSSSSFIDLKAFVTDILVPKGYSSGPTYSLARMMSGKGLVDIYEVKDDKGFIVKAVKTI